MSRSKFLLPALMMAAALALGACRDTGKEALFEITGRLVVFNYREAMLTYIVTLKPLKPIEAGQVEPVEEPGGPAPRCDVPD